MKARASRVQSRASSTMRQSNQNIQTRAQLKLQRETSSMKSTSANESTNEDIRKQEQKKPGWTSIVDVERKLLDLSKQLERAKKERSKRQIKKLIDVYEKQAKALNIKKSEEDKEAKERKMKEANEIFPIEEENEEEASVMSDITEKTNNSYKRVLSLTPTRKKPTSATDKSPYSERYDSGKSGVVLESIGLTRKGEEKQSISKTVVNKDLTSEVDCENRAQEKAIKITQDDTLSVMSDITYRKDTPNVEEKEKGEKEENIKVQKTCNDDDTASVMSGLTLAQDTSTVAPNEKVEEGRSKNDDSEVDNKDVEKTTEDESKSVMSDITKVETKQLQKKDDEMVKSPSAKTPVPNPYSTSKKAKDDTYAIIAKKDIEEIKISGDVGKDHSAAKKKQIKLRFSFTKQKYNGSKMAYVKQVLYELLQCAKLVDGKTGLAPWYEDTNLKVLNGNEVRLLKTDVIQQYIDLPDTHGDFNDNQIYYGNGVSLTTEMNIDEFINRWNYMRYERRQGNPFKNWKSIKAAEAQCFTQAVAVGYFVGSVENGYYETINEHLREKYNGEVEVSYQTIYQPGVTQRLWNEASEKAKEATTDTTSRDFKRIKFGLAPTALVAYANGPEKAKKYRSIFMKDFGAGEDEQWPMMPDASRMRFIPLVNEYISKKAIRDKMYENLKHQAISKAGDVILDLKYKNLREKKDYLDNQSLEQILHSKMTNDDDEIPLFKHITKRWDNKTSTMMYEIVVACSLLDEAKERLQGMNNVLLKDHGPKVRELFLGAQHGNSQMVMTRKRNFTVANNDYDDEIEMFIKKSTTKDKLSMVLIEGMEKLKDDEEKMKDTPKAMVIEIPDDSESEATSGKSKKSSSSKVNGDSITSSNVDSDSDEGKSIESIFIDKSEWDKIGLKDRYEGCISATERQVRKSLNTISEEHIDIAEVVKWQNENNEEMKRMMIECSNKEYSVMKRIVNEILKAKDKSEHQGKKHAGDEAGVDNPISMESQSHHQKSKMGDEGRGD